jgi:hypothetical protein
MVTWRGERGLEREKEKLTPELRHASSALDSHTKLRSNYSQLPGEDKT